LDRAAVVGTAAALADEQGLDGVTLAALALRLGIRTPSLYNHVAGLEGLRRELALFGTRELGARLGRAAVGKTTDKAVVALGEAYRAFVKEHPGLYAATIRASRPSEPEDRELREAQGETTETVIVVLRSYGLSGDDAVHAARGLRSLVHGFTTLESAGGFGLPLDLDESFRRLLQTFVRGLRGGEQEGRETERGG
jgi:AcrR family transcriptional regulator